MIQMRQARPDDIKVGNYVLHKQPFPSYNTVPVEDGYVAKHFISYEDDIFVWALLRIDKAKNGYISRAGYDTIPAGSYMVVEDEQAIEDFESYWEMVEETKREMPHLTQSKRAREGAGFYYDGDMNAEWLLRVYAATRPKYLKMIRERNQSGSESLYKKKHMPKTLLLENYGLLTEDTKKWIEGIDKDYVMIDSETKEYSREQDLWAFAMFIDPQLRTIATSSGFPTLMPYAAMKSFGRLEEFEEGNAKAFTQIEYYVWLLRNAVRFREQHKLQPLVLEVNYLGEDFLESLRNGYFGENTKTLLMLTLRQFEGQLTINLYKNHKPLKTLRTEDDLELNREEPKPEPTKKATKKIAKKIVKKIVKKIPKKPVRKPAPKKLGAKPLKKKSKKLKKKA